MPLWKALGALYIAVDNGASANRVAAYAGGMSRLIRVSTVFIATFGAGLIGFLFVPADMSLWYGGLTKPPLTPSDMLFGIVWVVLYALMALAACIVWLKKQNAETEAWLRFYFVQLLFNTAWMIFFFGFHAVPLAFTDGLVLMYIVFGLAVSGWEINPLVFYLMFPYFLWTAFALYLTVGIWVLN
jgi:benzodiazapine receptor